ncbi:MAG: amidohydrolase [Deltaproteobacteria bacterium]|nr:amidohydrolase [Deltaproteobacteria bacterium]
MLLLLVLVALAACQRGCDARGDESQAYEPKRISELRGPYKVINAHEHLQSVEVAERLLRTMDEMSVAKTVILAGSRRTTRGLQNEFVDYEENNAAMLEAARRWPERFVPFVTIDTDDPGKLAKLRRWIARGAKGVKLYSGHGEFYTRPLDATDMMEVYAYCEEHQVPILFHVNGGRYLDEFERVLQAHPDLQVICPHFCLLSNSPRTFRRVMDTYPRLLTDISFGIPAFMNDGLERVSDHVDRFRGLILAYPDRMLWGSDVVVTRHRRKSETFMKRVYGAYFAMLGERSYSYTAYDADYHVKTDNPTERNGLYLPPNVLRQIYEANFLQVVTPRP